MNADWAKGRNEKTGEEGIFPRSYVKIMDEKSAMPAPLPPRAPSNYGNVPMDVSQGGGGSMMGGAGTKTNDNAKKFGKKLGNAGMYLDRAFGMSDANSIRSNFWSWCDDWFEDCQRYLLGLWVIRRCYWRRGLRDRHCMYYMVDDRMVKAYCEDDIKSIDYIPTTYLQTSPVTIKSN